MLRDRTPAFRARAVRSIASAGWWHRYSDVLPSWYPTYIGLENAASLIRAYEVQFVHGLLQTEAYARAVLGSGMGAASEADIERRVAVRLERQQRLITENALQVHVVLDESVLRRPYGDRDVMRDQLHHLIAISELENVWLQIMPFSAGGHSSGAGPFAILRFPEPDLPDVVYVEQLTSALYLEKPWDVEQYEMALWELLENSLTPEKSRDLLRTQIQLL
ncbi:DUF5753 domain-containing protein [Streptomyces sp. NPDC001601]|uniref:DUF5753 domain-containing protein n=1 Tax=Streptomyces sp. NPDC001601 TaxID=3364592 RepID=UPI00368C430B